MSVEDKDKIDSMGINKETDVVTLAISDHLDWDNEYDHLIMLQEKINTYCEGSSKLSSCLFLDHCFNLIDCKSK